MAVGLALLLRFKNGLPAPAITYNPAYVAEDPDDLAKKGEIDGRAVAKRFGERARKKKSERFDLFGIEEIIPIVDNEHFEHEMSEAIQCYKRKLYLAATAVVGIALENILVLILKKNGLYTPKIQPYIKDYSKVLVDNELLEDRKRREILNFNNTRNGAAHSNSGVIWLLPQKKDFL